jgi:hypothetical protein
VLSGVFLPSRAAALESDLEEALAGRLNVAAAEGEAIAGTTWMRPIGSLLDSGSR